MRENQLLFTYLHLAPEFELTKQMMERKVTGVAYETIVDKQGRLPLLTPMSEVAGRMAIQVGAHCLERAAGGRGILLGGVPGVDPARVVIIGGGIAGSHAAEMAIGCGADVTIVSWSRQLQACAQAAEQLAAQGVQAELIDLRTLWPWDKETVLASARKTGRLLVVHEAVQVAGFGAEVAATVAEHTAARVARLGAPRIPVGYAANLEAEARVKADQIAAAAHRLLAR